jgi:hypothetical protein
MPETWTVAKAQAALGEMAFQLLRLSDLLAGINRRLALPPEPILTWMLEGETAPAVAVEVSGCIECVVFDYLPLVIQALQHAATVTAPDLEQDFRDHQEEKPNGQL